MKGQELKGPAKTKPRGAGVFYSPKWLLLSLAGPYI